MNQQPHRPPVALRSIALFEIAKGLLALVAAYGLISLRHTDLQAVTEEFLLRHGLASGTHIKRLFIESVARATHYPVSQIASFAVVYALIRFAEGFGLWYGKHWAEWFAVLSAGLYLPLELIHFAHHPTLFTASVILLNIALILYLGNLLVQERARRHGKSVPRSSSDESPLSRL
jgi:uncharacterized membrane protein (DUF2068 family)